MKLNRVLSSVLLRISQRSQARVVFDEKTFKLHNVDISQKRRSLSAPTESLTMSGSPKVTSSTKALMEGDMVSYYL